MPEYGIGQGFDIHLFTEGRPLMLGGVRIPYDRGLLGHSDGDALLHAVIDAVLGAMCKGDIGTLFPDTDPDLEGADSSVLASRVCDMMESSGYTAVNIDTTVITEMPKLSGYKQMMSDSISRLFHCVNVSVKAKTAEKCGEIGKGNALACECAVLLKRE